MLATLAPSLIRTYIPIAVAALVAWLGQIGVILPDGASDALATGLAAVVAGLYYLAIRLLEERWPWLGVLLGSPTAPSYAPATEDGAYVITDVQNVHRAAD